MPIDSDQDDLTIQHAKALEEINRLKVELVQARETSVLALKAKADFLSNMSHELRTPMNAVLGMAEALWETSLSADQRKILSILMKGGRSLLSIINDVLEFSRLENGQLPLNNTEFSLTEPVEFVTQLLGESAREKGLQLEVRESELQGLSVIGDSKKIEQVLIKLIGNAIKFTEKGRVTISVAQKLGAAHELIEFSVSDTGPGIESEKLAEIFNRFSQADMSVTKMHGGTGLGLAITRQLVELMGGTICVKSTPGAGTTFYFTVKLKRANNLSLSPVRSEVSEEAAILPRATAPEDLKILVVEDSTDNAFLIQTFLKNINAKLEFAENGQIAVDKFETGDFDLVLMDMQMPLMDGYSATRWIRLLERRRAKRVPIIALTAFAFAEEIQKSFDAGCDTHLAKPISKRSLLGAIADRLAPEYRSQLSL